MTLTVILPAAGKGTRLNLPYPKEILRLDKNQALIDYSFDYFKDYDRNSVDFVVVINEFKTDIVGYLSKYKHKYNIAFVYQNPLEKEYTGAIKSANHLFGEYNLVLLPDTIMKLKNGNDLFELVKTSLTETGFTFLYKDEVNKDVLKTKGALYVDDQKIIKDYQDKPQTDLDKFNAFWCAFAFRRRAFKSCMDFMEKSTLKQQVDSGEIEATPIYNSKAIDVEDYVDLGTWDEIKRLLINEKDNN